MMKNIFKYTIALAAAFSLTGCANDFLDQKNTYQLSQETFFDSEESLTQATAPLYSYVWYDFNDKFYYSMGDGRANNITAQYSDYIYPYTNFTETSLSVGLTEAWAALYSVVSQSNNTINNIKNYATGVSETAKEQAIAEARFMRGLAYWYIGTLWGCGIIYENTSDLVNNYVVKAQPRADVIEFAIRDMEYAAKNLPETNATGRVNRYSAFGMLSRFYLSMAGLTTEGEYNQSNVATDFNRGTRNSTYLKLAKAAAEEVIDNSGASLMDSYAELFNINTFDNNQECLFQLQFMPGTGMGGAANSMTRFFAWSTMVADTHAWGGATYCSWDLWEEFKEYSDRTLGTVDDAKRRHECVASYGEYYSELGDYTYGVTENPGNQGANIKKYVVGTKKVNNISESDNSGINTYMLRLAEVYLNYVEAQLFLNNGTITNGDALDLFNAIRTRANMPTKSEIKFEDLRHEFRVEFAFEGLYWYQLVRWAYCDQQFIVNYLNNQNRNASYFESSTNTYKISDSYVAPGSSVQIATASNLVLPMSDADQTKNPNLKPDSNGNISTEAWNFDEREVSHGELFPNLDLNSDNNE